MDRRELLKLAGLSGLALMAPFGRGVARAQTAPRRYEGPYFIMVHASGGWDPTYVCDPKGGMLNRLYMPDQIKTAGNLKYAPLEYKNGQGLLLYSNQMFFEKFKDKLMVVNGLDTTTGNHDTGTRVMWSGRVTEGFPTFAALVAGAKTPGNPLGFISSGGYEATGGLVPLTRLGNVDAFRRIAYPNRPDPNNANYGYYTDETRARIERVQKERLDDARARQGLPRIARSMSSLYMARAGNEDVATLAAQLPSSADINNAQNPLERQALVSIAGFRAGLAVAANLVVGGFDTHGNHDGAHPPAVWTLLQGVDLIMDALAKNGLADKTIVIVGSDFGRTPMYNVNGGKDHWNITSMMLMGPGIPGGKVVGATTDAFQATTVNAKTLAPDANGTRIRCDHVQLALRKLAGIDGSDAAKQFPIGPTEDLPLFS